MPVGRWGGMNKLALPLLMLTFMLFPATGSAAPPEGVEAEVLVGPVSFPKTTAGTESPAVEIDVRNDGDAGTWVEKNFVDGPDSGAYKVTSSDCNTLEPGAHCSVWIVFMPGDLAPKQATLNLKMGDGSTAGTPIDATAVPVQLAFTPGAGACVIARTEKNGWAGSMASGTATFSRVPSVCSISTRGW